MRAICGAIITAGALIGLGLTALGIGTRYQGFSERDAESRVLQYVRFRDMDTSLEFSLVFLAGMAVVGLGIALVGLALHHERRTWERSQHGTPLPPGDAETGIRSPTS